MSRVNCSSNCFFFVASISARLLFDAPLIDHLFLPEWDEWNMWIVCRALTIFFLTVKCFERWVSKKEKNQNVLKQNLFCNCYKIEFCLWSHNTLCLSLHLSLSSYLCLSKLFFLVSIHLVPSSTHHILVQIIHPASASTLLTHFFLNQLCVGHHIKSFLKQLDNMIIENSIVFRSFHLSTNSATISKYWLFLPNPSPSNA